MVIISNPETQTKMVPGYTNSKIENNRGDYFLLKENENKFMEYNEVTKESDFFSYKVDGQFFRLDVSYKVTAKESGCFITRKCENFRQTAKWIIPLKWLLPRFLIQENDIIASMCKK